MKNILTFLALFSLLATTSANAETLESGEMAETPALVSPAEKPKLPENQAEAKIITSPKAKRANEDADPELDGVKEVKGKERTLTLASGVARTLEFPFKLGPIFISEQGLVEFKRLKDGGIDNKIYIRPLNSGVTSMLVHDIDGNLRFSYTLRVTREDMGILISQLEELLGDIEGLKIKSVGGTVVLDGEILLPKDMLRIIRVVDAIKDRDPKKKEVPVKNLVTISKMTMNILAERIEREIGSPEITVKVVNNNLFLEGTAEGEFEADRALEIAKTYIPEVIVQKGKGDNVEVQAKKAGGESGIPTIIDMMRVRPRPAAPPAQDIKVTMNYVELSNDYEKQFDFQWRPLANDTSTLKFDSSLGEFTAGLVATVTSLIPKLNNAASHGHARILKQQTIIVRDRSDSPASVDNAVDIYTTQLDQQGQPRLTPVTVQNSLRVKAATLPGSDAIDLGLQISLNSLLGSAPGSPPQIARNTIQTQVTIKNGDSAALGGSSIDQALAGYNRTPTQTATGSSAPSGSPIFNMQRSKNFIHNKNQYVIFVTPEVLKTASSGTEDITRKFRLNAGEQ